MYDTLEAAIYYKNKIIILFTVTILFPSLKKSYIVPFQLNKWSANDWIQWLFEEMIHDKYIFYTWIYLICNYYPWKEKKIVKYPACFFLYLINGHTLSNIIKQIFFGIKKTIFLNLKSVYTLVCVGRNAECFLCCYFIYFVLTKFTVIIRNYDISK